jgi:hypothetical protein
VDDIIISGNDEAVLQKCADELNDIASLAQFPFGASKKEGPGPAITAFNIEVSHEMLQITKARLAELRSAYRSTTSPHSQRGIVGYVASVNSDQIDALI